MDALYKRSAALRSLSFPKIISAPSDCVVRKGCSVVTMVPDYWDARLSGASLPNPSCTRLMYNTARHRTEMREISLAARHRSHNPGLALPCYITYQSKTAVI
jgi:hypothetical protein